MEIDKQKATLLLLACTLLLLLFSGSIVLAYGQQQTATPPPGNNVGAQEQHYRRRPDDRHRSGGRQWRRDGYRGHMRFRGRGPMQGRLRLGPPGRWWGNPDMVSKLGLTTEQQKRMDDIFQQSRLSLIDLVAAVQKQELIMQPLLNADQPDEAKIIAQIDRVAQARAELEKANARMLLGLRRVLTPDQWQKLQAMRQRWDGLRGGGPDGWRRGPGGNGGDGPPPPPPGF